MSRMSQQILGVTFTLTTIVCFRAQAQSAHVLIVGDERISFVAQPEAGYVVKTQQKTGSISALSSTLSFLASEHARPIRGLDRHGVWVVEDKRPAGENEKTIKTLRADRQIQYAAPLFSSYGETVAVIPEIVVRVKPATAIEQLQQLCRTARCTIKKRMEFTTQEYLLEVLGPDADAVFAAVEQINEISFVQWACPNTVSRLRLAGKTISAGGRVHAQDSGEAAGASTTAGVITNDEYFSEQWHLHNTGQFGYKPNADINAPEAWEITTGDPNIIIAICDTGVELNHPDLVNNLVPGYDFYDSDVDPSPAQGENETHGTMCAGFASAQGNNGIGVAGVTWNCKIMPIRMRIFTNIPRSAVAD